MKNSIPKVVSTILVITLFAVLGFVIWRPVFPSGWIIQGMADQLHPDDLSLDRPTVLRFELAGKGGGFYNLLLSTDKVEVTEGDTSQADLIVAMKASDFNQLVLKMAQGKADEFYVRKLVVSNMLRVAGDMSVLELLKQTDRGEQ